MAKKTKEGAPMILDASDVIMKYLVHDTTLIYRLFINCANKSTYAVYNDDKFLRVKIDIPHIIIINTTRFRINVSYNVHDIDRAKQTVLSLLTKDFNNYMFYRYAE